jgi:hypothetical protein
MGDGPLFSFLILSSYFLLPTSYFLLPTSYFLLSSFFFAPSRLCTFAFFSSRVFFFPRFFLPAFFSSSQPRQEQQPEPGTFGV